MSPTPGQIFTAVEKQLAAEGRLGSRPARRSRQRRPRPPASSQRYDPATGKAIDPLDDLRNALDALDKNDGLTDRREVTGAFKMGLTGASYGLTLASGAEIVLGNAKQLLKPRDVQAAIFDATGVALTVPTLDQWREVAEAIHAAADMRDVSLTREEEAAEWVADFLAANRFAHTRRANTRQRDLANVRDLAAVLTAPDEPFIDQDRRVWVRLAPLLRHTTVTLGQRTSQRDLSERLGSLGFRREQLSARVAEEADDDGDHGRVVKARFWFSRPGWSPDDDPASPSPLTLSDLSTTPPGTWGRGDNGAGPDDPHNGGGDDAGTNHAGTARPHSPKPPSNKGETT